ncbi:MAG: hypothetical protein AB7E45_04325 [Candidatus Caldatribacteriota bacterium]
MQTIELNKRVASIEVSDDKIIINLEQKYIPKDGEYFYVETKLNSKFIGIKKEGEYITSRYCAYDIKRSRINNYQGMVSGDEQIKEIRPATTGEIELFDKTLHDNGVKWNSETKKVEALPKVGDFCIFWNGSKKYARCGVLEEIDPTRKSHYLINYYVYFLNCIPFQSVEHFKEFIK